VAIVVRVLAERGRVRLLLGLGRLALLDLAHDGAVKERSGSLARAGKVKARSACSIDAERTTSCGCENSVLGFDSFSTTGRGINGVRYSKTGGWDGSKTRIHE
jgi:hypothetical protein